MAARADDAGTLLARGVREYGEGMPRTQDDPIERFASSLVETVPWATALPGQDRERFVAECAEVLRSCATAGDYSAFAELVEDWRATAEVHRDPELARRLSEAVDEPLGREV